MKIRTSDDFREMVLETDICRCMSANILLVRAETNCPQGGDAGHGGKTHLVLEDEGGTCMFCRIDGKGEPVFASSIEIIMGGDTECDTFIEALEFAVARLKAEREENRQAHEYRCEYGEAAYRENYLQPQWKRT